MRLSLLLQVGISLGDYSGKTRVWGERALVINGSGR